MNQAETYYLKAVTNYPFDYNEVCESLNYALSHDPHYAPALCLKAKIYLYEKTSLSAAKTYFELALQADPQHIDTYQFYGELLLPLGGGKRFCYTPWVDLVHFATVLECHFGDLRRNYC